MNTKKNSHYQFTHELIQQTMARLFEKNELKDISFVQYVRNHRLGQA